MSHKKCRQNRASKVGTHRAHLKGAVQQRPCSAVTSPTSSNPALKPCCMGISLNHRKSAPTSSPETPSAFFHHGPLQLASFRVSTVCCPGPWDIFFHLRKQLATSNSFATSLFKCAIIQAINKQVLCNRSHITAVQLCWDRKGHR